MTEKSIDLGTCARCNEPLRPLVFYQNYAGKWVIVKAICSHGLHDHAHEINPPVIIDQKPARGHRLTP